MSDLFLSAVSNVWALLLVVFFFGGSIFVHELGHFLAARRRGVHVERFSIGFGPAIWKRRGRDGVEYRVSWFPLGGYVLLPQLADLGPIEGESVADVSKLPPVSYTTKLLVFVAGATFNLLFAFVLALVLWGIGRPVTEDISSTRIGRVSPTMATADGTQVPSPAAVAGVQAGDRVISVDGRPVTDWMEFQHRIISSRGVDEQGNRALDLTVERDGKILTLRLNPVRSGDENFRRIGVEPEYNVWVADVTPASAAETLGLRTGDRIAAINGQNVRSGGSMYELIHNAPAGQASVTVERNGALVTLQGNPETKLAEQFESAAFEMKQRLVHQTPWKQFSASIEMTVDTLVGLLHPRGDITLSNLSGPIGIGRGFWNAAKSEFPIHFALWFAVLVNINLAIFNLLPIPVLDGGQIVFATIARLRGKPLPVNFIMATQSVFMVLFLMMFVYVTIQGDIRRWARDLRAERAEAAAPAK